MCTCLAQITFALKLVSKNITGGPKEVGIILTGLGYGLEPRLVRVLLMSYVIMYVCCMYK